MLSRYPHPRHGSANVGVGRGQAGAVWGAGPADGRAHVPFRHDASSSLQFVFHRGSKVFN